jgi:hypothetical protein
MGVSRLKVQSAKFKVQSSKFKPRASASFCTLNFELRILFIPGAVCAWDFCCKSRARRFFGEQFCSFHKFGGRWSGLS